MTHTDVKKILIVYATAGAGHKKAAQALARSATLSFAGKVVLTDIIDFMPSVAKALYSDGYSFLISHFPFAWGILYRLSDTPFLSIINVHVRRFTDSLMCRRFLAYLKAEQPDIVISTQFLASEMTAYAKAKKLISSRLVTVVTDYGVHNFWINPGTDLYCCAADSSRRLLLNKDVPQDRIRVTGIPLDEKFLHVKERTLIHQMLGTDPRKFTVLIATGGIGMGPIEELVEKLKDHLQIFVVCGTNQHLLKSLEKKGIPNVKVFGFIDNMQELMKASDVMVTKAGGLSVTEALSMGLPMIFFCLLPGQETINAGIMHALKSGRIAQDTEEIIRHILHFKEDPQDLELFHANALRLSKLQSSSDIISAALASK